MDGCFGGAIRLFDGSCRRYLIAGLEGLGCFLTPIHSSKDYTSTHWPACSQYHTSGNLRPPAASCQGHWSRGGIRAPWLQLFAGRYLCRVERAVLGFGWPASFTATAYDSGGTRQQCPGLVQGSEACITDGSHCSFGRAPKHFAATGCL